MDHEKYQELFLKTLDEPKSKISVDRRSKWFTGPKTDKLGNNGQVNGIFSKKKGAGTPFGRETGKSIFLW